MSHTKGPWTKGMGTTEFHKVPMLEEILGPNQELVIVANDYELNISEANSNLILKAPDMYGVIKALLDQYDRKPIHGLKPWLRPLYDAIKGIE